MARRKSSGPIEGLLNDIWEILVVTPWWTCPLIATFFYLVFAYAVPAMFAHNQLMMVWVPASRNVLAPLAGLTIPVMGLAAQVVKWQKGATLDRQSGADTINSLTWRQFEELIGVAYSRLGYWAVETDNGPDGGVDLILRGHGEKVIVQCKQWRSQRVGVKELREFHGVLKSRNTTANRGIFVTFGEYTQEARRFAKENSIELVGRDGLLDLIRSAQKGSAPTASSLDDLSGSGTDATIPNPAKQPDPACPVCGKPMILRTARRGENAGSQFWGCSTYPKCRGTRQHVGV